MSGLALTAKDFPAFFAAVHGDPPFPWQDRLLGRIAESGKWPAVLDLPTGSGKTAALDIAVFHLALEAARGSERRAPVRIAFVVDRRLIVDDAYGRAQRIADGVCWSLLEDAGANALEAKLIAREKAEFIDLLRRVRAEPVVAEVALRLRVVAGNDEPPLLARRLRGGAPREDDWARTPVQPTILCSTVDQVGSRLLFRGYGVSDRMKPIHAGLLGSDCLILLDEAHLAEPFRQTLDAVGRLQGKTDGAPWGVALLTATPWRRNQEKREEEPFKLAQEDREHEILSKRLFASKPAGLIEIPGKQGVPAENRRVEEIAERALAALRTLRETISEPAIGVVVNRVARARAVFERIKKELGDEASVILVIGPARSVDRDSQLNEALAPIRTGAARGLTEPLIVVATQTIEAGVDIDLDGLVTEAAALDALRQRFGRLNRAGREIAPVAVILAHKDDVAPKADDPVYGDRIAATWKALCDAAGPPDAVVDFGIEAFPQELMDGAAKLVSPKPDAPVLMPAHADLWSQTWPIPNADPEIGLFLHGPKSSAAGVQIVWRADIREADLADRAQNRDSILEILALMPPRAAEAIEVPLWTVRAWLRREPPAAFSDAVEAPPEEARSGGGRPAFRYAGTDSERSAAIFPDQIRPGDLIVVPATYSGCDTWGWNPNSVVAVADVADTAAEPYSSRRFAVRLTPELVEQEFWIAAGEETIAADVGPDLAALLAGAEEESPSDLLDRALAFDGLPLTIRQQLDDLKRHRRGRLECRFPYGHDGEGRLRGVIFLAPFGLHRIDRGAELCRGGSRRCSSRPFGLRRSDRGAELDSSLPTTEIDEAGSFPGYEQVLDEHSNEVRDRALAEAERAGLPAALAADIGRASYRHDAGKADPRFQAYLHGGNAWECDPNRVLAKSGRRVMPRNARERAELPDNWRHEALSVRLAQRNPGLHEANDPMLVLWLIGVHHGFGRPLFPHRDELDTVCREFPAVLDIASRLEPGPGPQSLAFDFDGRDWAQMFDELKRRYGIWGLARLEAFVRLADHRASAAAERRYAAREAPDV